MSNTIRTLEEIQKIDLEVLAIEAGERGLKEEMERVSAEAAAHEDGVRRLGAEVEELNVFLKNVDERIRQNLEQIGKDEKRVASIKNTRELNAVTKEISAANKSKRQNEQEKANYAAKLEEKRIALGSLEDALKARRARLEELAAELESKMPVWKQAADEKIRLRDNVKAGLRPDVFKRYENIRAKRGGVGLALIKNETCQGCHINIPPQVYIELRKGAEEIYTCPHCHRILYVENQDQPETV